MASTTPLKPSGGKSSGAKKHLDPLDLYDVRSALSDEEQMVQDTVRRFVADQFMPLVQDAFEKHYFPREVVPQIAELGLLGSSIEGYDCAGLNSICYGLICQELERGDSGLRSFVSVQSSLVMYPIHAFGSEEQRSRWLPPLAKGEAIGCFGLTEPHGGSDPANMKTHAKRDGDDWVLNGSKMWITNGSVADVAVVWAMTDDGIRGFIVEKDMPGFTAQEIEHKFSLQSLRYRGVVLRQRPGAGLERAAGRHGPQGATELPDPGALRHHLGRDRRSTSLPGGSAELQRRSRAVRSSPVAQPGRTDTAG